MHIRANLPLIVTTILRLPLITETLGCNTMTINQTVIAKKYRCHGNYSDVIVIIVQILQRLGQEQKSTKRAKKNNCAEGNIKGCVNCHTKKKNVEAIASQLREKIVP